MKKKHVTTLLLLISVAIFGTGALFAQGAKEVAPTSYLGEITSIKPSEDGFTYELLVKDANGNETLFRTTEQTQATLPLASLSTGDYVEIGYNGITTRSIPPQATADSVRWITALVKTGVIDLKDIKQEPAAPTAKASDTATTAKPTTETTPATQPKPAEKPTVNFNTKPEAPATTTSQSTATTAPASKPATATTTTTTPVTSAQTAVPATPAKPAMPAQPASSSDKQVPNKPVQLDENTYLYRGTVVDRSAADNHGNVMLLVQALLPGIGYGQPEIRFIVSPDTTGDAASAKVGDYVEVTYGPAMTMSIPPQTSALSVKVLPNPSIVTANVIYYGKMFDDNTFKTGSILVMNPATEQEEIYLFDDGTIINLNIFELPIGSHISLYHRGTMTRSYPAQGFAYCIDYTYGE